jgi:hypothetical protein
MVNNIEINQRAIVDNGLSISLRQAAIIDVLRKLSMAWQDMTKLYLNNRTYYWFDYGKVLHEAPLLGIEKKDTLYREMKALRAGGFLMAHPDNAEMGKPFYCFSDKCAMLYSSAPSENNPTPRKYSRGVGKNPEGSENNPGVNEEKQPKTPGENPDPSEKIPNPRKIFRTILLDNNIEREKEKKNEGEFSENFENEPNPGRENFERLQVQEEERKKVAQKKESADVLREQEASTDIDMTQLTFAPNMNPELIARVRAWIGHKKQKNPKYRQVNAQAAIEDIYAKCAALKKSFDGNLEKAQAFVCDAIRHAIAQDYQTVITDAKAVQQYKERISAPEPEAQPRKGYRQDKKPANENNVGAQYSDDSKYQKY